MWRVPVKAPPTLLLYLSRQYGIHADSSPPSLDTGIQATGSALPSVAFLVMESVTYVSHFFFRTRALSFISDQWRVAVLEIWVFGKRVDGFSVRTYTLGYSALRLSDAYAAVGRLSYGLWSQTHHHARLGLLDMRVFLSSVGSDTTWRPQKGDSTLSVILRGQIYPWLFAPQVRWPTGFGNIQRSKILPVLSSRVFRECS
jgi:hypothetical protein